MEKDGRKKTTLSSLSELRKTTPLKKAKKIRMIISNNRIA